MEVSWNRGTPKSSILIGFSNINHPFGGTPIYGNPHMNPAETNIPVRIRTISCQNQLLTISLVPTYFPWAIPSFFLGERTNKKDLDRFTYIGLYVRGHLNRLLNPEAMSFFFQHVFTIMGKSSVNGPLSIAMLNNQRVYIYIRYIYIYMYVYIYIWSKSPGNNNHHNHHVLTLPWRQSRRPPRPAGDLSGIMVYQNGIAIYINIYIYAKECHRFHRFHTHICIYIYIYIYDIYLYIYHIAVK